MANADETPDREMAWLEAVMDRHEGPLVRYAARIVGDVDRARDVVQDTFVRLWRSDRRGSDDRLDAWLFAVCRNRALDVRRKERRMTRLSEPDVAGRPDVAPSPAAAAEQSDTSVRVAAAMAELPPRQQEVLRLKFQNGLAYKQIAEVTGLSVSNVGFLIHRGLSQLRQRFQAAGLIGEG